MVGLLARVLSRVRRALVVSAGRGMARESLPVSQAVMPRLPLWATLGMRVLAGANPTDPLVNRALEAEARLDSAEALRLFQQAAALQPTDVFLLQKIAKQYSDLVVDQATDELRKQFAQTALGFAERAMALKPDDAVNVLSLAVCHGTLAVYSDTTTKIRYSRLVK